VNRDNSANLDRLAELVATWFGSGRSPIAPGTVGSIAAVPLHLVVRRLPGFAHLSTIALTVAAGIWAGERVARRLGVKDPQIVVIDEVAGVLIAMGLVGRRRLSSRLLALALFRILDIAKPGPINHAQSMDPPGVGIMADDVLAGIIAGLVTRLVTSR
jgi:phosphatidylglycerophosphatase A